VLYRPSHPVCSNHAKTLSEERESFFALTGMFCPQNDFLFYFSYQAGRKDLVNA
jgi:hypothetical protein